MYKENSSGPNTDPCCMYYVHFLNVWHGKSSEHEMNWSYAFVMNLRLLWMLYALSGRSAVHLSGGHSTVFLWHCSVLRLWTSGPDRERKTYRDLLHPWPSGLHHPSIPVRASTSLTSLMFSPDESTLFTRNLKLHNKVWIKLFKVSKETLCFKRSVILTSLITNMSFSLSLL